jgi:arginyl-tRNA synthetase
MSNREAGRSTSVTADMTTGSRQHGSLRRMAKVVNMTGMSGIIRPIPRVMATMTAGMTGVTMTTRPGTAIGIIVVTTTNIVLVA